MSLMTIVSRHHEHRSYNMVTFHHSKPIDRQLPAPPQHEVHGKCGTRVTVRNLFGNLPVRVKQRAVLAEDKAEHDRLWKVLEREVISLLLSWRGQLSLRIRDMHGKTFINFSSTARTSEAAEPHSSWLSYTLNVLTQANYILHNEWSSWIPVSASTSLISIKGAISLDPAPSKCVQFISFGIRPFTVDFENNELYDEVNRIFSRSSFGIVENDAGVNENEKIRRRSDKRFKSDGYTNRQLTARKGVDRFPMFDLHITLKARSGSSNSEERFMENDTNLQTVTGVLSAVITEWLSVHHFRPHKPRPKRNPGITSSTRLENDKTLYESISDMPLQHDQTSFPPQNKGTASGSSTNHSSKRKLLNPSATSSTSERMQHRAFAEWSRVKSGKADFFDTLNTSAKLSEGRNPARLSSNLTASSVLRTDTPASSGFAKFDNEPLPAGFLNETVDQTYFVNKKPDYEGAKYDETMTWTDPSTKKTFLLNARTGCVLPRALLGPLSPSSLQQPGTLDKYNNPLRLPRKPATSGEPSTPWLSDVLKTWTNPVFKPVQKGIRQACHHEHQFEGPDQKQINYFNPACDDTGEWLYGSSGTNIGKLSKVGLGRAEVLAQLDKKFILAKVQNSTSDVGKAAEVLVLVDQHAADERVQVEALVTELCKPPTKDQPLSKYRSKLGHQSHVTFTVLEKPIRFTISTQEYAHFITHAARFAAWGILFEAEPSSQTLIKQQPVLSVTTLPSVISERCRAYPQVLISFLRSAVWRYADGTVTLPPFNGDSHPNDEPVSWVRRISTCPEGLIDLINSRACRSAVMFNDELSLDECKKLMRKLSECVFPFICAHGRPSMVPLVNLGSVEDAGRGDIGSGNAKHDEKGGFVGAWKGWKGK
jgi:DNA mismatch repair protein MLH3